MSNPYGLPPKYSHDEWVNPEPKHEWMTWVGMALAYPLAFLLLLVAGFVIGSMFNIMQSL